GDHTISGEWKVDSYEPKIDRKKIAAIVCFGNLTVEGDLLNQRTYHEPVLFVAGDLKVRNLIKGGMPLIVLGSLLADGYVIDLRDEGMDGPFMKDPRGGLLRVGGDLVAAGYVPNTGDFTDIRGHVVAGSVRAPMFDARVHGRAEMRVAFAPEALTDGWYDPSLILSREHEGLPVWRDPSTPAPPPLEESTPPPLPQVAGVNPVSFGTLSPAEEVKPRLLEMIAAAVPHDPASFSYPEMYAQNVRYSLQSPDSPVLVLPPGTHLSGDLELDWESDWIQSEWVAGVVCEGDLTVDGDVLNRNLDTGPLLFVGGTLRVRNLIKSGSPVIVLGDVEASGMVIGEYNHGSIHIRGDLRALLFILLDHAGFVHGKTHAREVGRFDNPRDILVPEVFEDPYEDYPFPEVDWLWARQRAGLPVLK
ncbi:MAG TPA: hypothetical protein VFR31_04955, partial [Thermoanaerobaculia bacterium]|nr:hypothetical protein [Thermoanaerobaculia bacterium]